MVNLYYREEQLANKLSLLCGQYTFQAIAASMVIYIIKGLLNDFFLFKLTFVNGLTVRKAQYNITETSNRTITSGNTLWRKLLNTFDENKEALPFVEKFFRKSDANLDLTTIRKDAQNIAKVFPYYSIDYIAERLRVVGNEENSIAIVLRQLLAKHGKSKASREANLKNLEKYCVEEAYAKADTDKTELAGLFSYKNGEDSLDKFVMNFLGKSNNNNNVGRTNNIEPDFENRPSTSKDCTINKPCTSTKSATVVSSTSNLDMLCETATSELPEDLAYETPDSQTDVIDQTIEKVVQSSSDDFSKKILFDTIQETIEDVVKSFSHDNGAAENFAGALIPTEDDFGRWHTWNMKEQNYLHKTQDDFRPTVIKQFNSWDLQKGKKCFMKPSKLNLPATVTKSATLTSTTGKQQKIDLVASLKELFPDKSEQDIYVSCLHHNIDVNKLPEDSAFDLLLQELCSNEQSTDFSVEKKNTTEEANDNIEEVEDNVEEPREGNVPNEEVVNQDDGRTEEPPAAKKAKTNDEDNMPNNFRFRIVKVDDSHERRFVQIPHADENASRFPFVQKQPAVQLSDTDSCDDMNPDEMDVDTDNDLIESEDLPQTSYDNKLLSKLMEIFSDACPIFIKRLCTGKIYSHEIIDQITNHIFSIGDYPKRRPKSPSPEPDWNPEKQLDILKEILPDADPNYLQYQVELHVNNQEKLKNFISNAIEKQNYPTMKEYLRKQQLSAQEKQYTSEFKVEKFLEVIPDPESYFNDDQRKPTVTSKPGDMTYHYAFKFLKNMYLSVPIRTISSIFSRYQYNLIKTKSDLDKILKSGNGLMKSKRKLLPITDMIQNIPFLQEVAYLQHQDEILEFIKTKKEIDETEKNRAREAGLLQTCNCCYDDEVMPKCIMRCENGCSFCKTCIQKSVEIAFGEGKLDFPCLGDCNAHFNLQTLQLVLSPKLFSKMVQKKQLEEVKAAGIEDLETCPFCDFATIPAPGDKLFKCFNPECMKESCRECKEPSHIPLRCDEIEKDDDVKRRVYIENKMTEALLRKCYKCGLKFIKSDGCNKMTCSCGASMCYICGKPVKDYKHFNGQGGDQYHLCPLYNDTNELHQQEVLRGAEEAKQEIGVNQDPTKLKIDPTADLDRHYQKARNPHQLPPGMHVGHMPPRPPQLGRDDIYFHVGVRVNQNHVQFDHVHRHHHHHHHHHRVQGRHQEFL